MRMLAGTHVAADGDSAPADSEWANVVAGPWVAETLKGLRSPNGLAPHRSRPSAEWHAAVLPASRCEWLYLLAKLGLGACLADDMGLGKTIQVLALLLVLHRRSDGNRQPSLLVAPASLLPNWASEMERFAPSLKASIAHPSELPAKDLKTMAPSRLRGADLGDYQLRFPTPYSVPWSSSFTGFHAQRDGPRRSRRRFRPQQRHRNWRW
jgi:hypothetical protein